MSNAETSNSNNLRCVVVTPEETVLDTEANFVALPLYDGELGICPRHSSMIGRLGYGELRIRTEPETARYYVDGGFVQVADDLVSVLTNRSIAAEALDVSAAEEQLQSALSSKASGEDKIAQRDRTLAQARGQLRMVRRPK